MVSSCRRFSLRTGGRGVGIVIEGSTRPPTTEDPGEDGTYDTSREE